VLADSGYSHRDAAAWAIPLRRAGAQLVQDLHPHDRRPQGTHQGAIIANGALYCPRTPRRLLELGPLPPGATSEQATAHDAKTAELARRKLGSITADDADGYHRAQCPAAMGKIRCPLRPASMTLDRDRPEILTPPENSPACCTQQTITVPHQINAKTRQKHDYPSAAWRRSYARRTSAERGFATTKDPATSDIHRGWCRLMGLTPLMLFTTALLITRNQRVLTAWNTPASRKPAPRRQRPPSKNPAPPPQGPRRAHRHQPALTPPASPATTARPTPAHGGSTRATRPGLAKNDQTPTNHRTQQALAHPTECLSTECQTRTQHSAQSPNVNKAPTQT